jgi:phage tail tape-measure protein
MMRLIALAGMAALAACGTNANDRTQGGAAAGAATGAGIGILGGPIGVVMGAVIGGGAGALTGATTKPNTVNLGEPPWSDADERAAGKTY